MRRWFFAGSSISSGAQHDLMKPSRSTCEKSSLLRLAIFLSDGAWVRWACSAPSRERIPAEEASSLSEARGPRPWPTRPGAVRGDGGRQGGDTAVNTGNTPPESKGRDPDALRVQAAASSHGRPAETKRGPRLPTSSVSNAMGMTNVPAAATMEKAATVDAPGSAAKVARQGDCLPTGAGGGTLKTDLPRLDRPNSDKFRRVSAAATLALPVSGTVVLARTDVVWRERARTAHVRAT